jgi:hypothetical protein
MIERLTGELKLKDIICSIDAIKNGILRMYIGRSKDSVNAKRSSICSLIRALSLEKTRVYEFYVHAVSVHDRNSLLSVQFSLLMLKI